MRHDPVSLPMTSVREPAADAAMVPVAAAAGVPALDCAGIAKQFDGVPVLKGITARFEPGTVNILAAENGAGKSTLFKIISGQLVPDAGSVTVFGEKIGRFDPRFAQQRGISIIPQELMPIPEMRVYENLLIGLETRGPLGLLNRRQMIDQARRMLESFELEIDPAMKMRQVSIAATQLIEILKATSRDARIVLMDEPTSTLSSREAEHLFRVIRLLRGRGACILYTSHKMEEIETIGDTVTIMRDGQLIRQAAVRDLTESQIVTDMVGRKIENLFPDQTIAARGQAAPILSARDLRLKGSPAANSFDLHRGEILGLAGLVGAGRSEMLEAIFGIRPASGTVTIDGATLSLGHVGQAIGRGLAMVPEDRKLAGVLTSQSILNNVTLPRLPRFTRLGLLNNGKRRSDALAILQRTQVRYARLGQLVAHLSGGNQQKIALARWLIGQKPKVLILDEPTRGIDVGARSELYRLFIELAAEGIGILLASSDMNELLNLSHRVLVLRGGRIVGELKRNELQQERILRLAMGLQPGDAVYEGVRT